MYDPNTAVGGNQPYGFDQLMAMYDHYTVIGSKIIAKFASTATGDQENGLIGIALMDTPTALTDWRQYVEKGNCVYSFIQPSGTAGPDSTAMLTMSFSPKKFLSRSHPMSDPQLKGTDSSNPTEQAYFHIFGISFTGVAAANAVFFHPVIEYISVFFEPKALTTS
jgi:hypothetical protein